jgi:hypothetical protein
MLKVESLLGMSGRKEARRQDLDGFRKESTTGAQAGKTLLEKVRNPIVRSDPGGVWRRRLLWK